MFDEICTGCPTRQDFEGGITHYMEKNLPKTKNYGFGVEILIKM